jgi:hypothetical protein
MRAFVITTFALAVALAPAAAFAQATTPPAQQPPAQQPQTQQPPAGQGAAAQPATTAPAAPKVPFTTPAGMLLVQIKPDKTADFEEMIGKLRAGFAKTADADLKKQAAGFKVYKSSEPFGANTLYVVLLEPTVPNTEYELFNMLLRTMTPEEQRDPGAKAMWDRYAGAFAAGLSKLSLTPLGG